MFITLGGEKMCHRCWESIVLVIENHSNVRNHSRKTLNPLSPSSTWEA